MSGKTYTKDINEIAEKLGRTYWSIKNRVSKLKAKRQGFLGRMNNDEIEFILNNKHLSSYQISEILCRPASSIRSLRKRKGVS